jgi:hypothetical protein
LREELRKEPGRSDRAFREKEPQLAPLNPLIEAARELLAIMLVRPDLAARPLREGIETPGMDKPVEISSLRASEQRLYPSLDSLRAAWFRLAALSRERAKLSTDDFDEKYRLHAEMKILGEAAAEARNLTLEP